MAGMKRHVWYGLVELDGGKVSQGEDFGFLQGEEVAVLSSLLGFLEG
jgi:hypothetical protein